MQAIKRVEGLEVWPKLFTNLRASRATEIQAQYGPKAESEWIGHGVEVAMQHYVMVTDDTWVRASQRPGQKN